MDEVELVIKGKVDEWRILRQHAYINALSAGTMKNPPSIEKMFPLPYDDELGSVMSADDIVDFYNSVVSKWN